MKRTGTDTGTQASSDSNGGHGLEQPGALSAEVNRLLSLNGEPQAGQLSQAEGASPPGVVSPTSPVEQADSRGRRLAVNTLIVGGAFILSRVLGVVREAVIASQFGTTPQASAYQTAFGIPDTLFLLIIGGAAGSAFIPVFSGLVAKGKERDAWKLASTLINASVVLLSLGAIVMSLMAPALVAYIIAPGQTVDKSLVVDLTRILLLSPLFMGLGGWAMGILNARQHFTLPALAPVVYNLAIIFGALVFAGQMGMGIQGVAWGVVLGSALHFGVQVPGLVRAGMKYAPRLNLRDAGVAEVGRLLGPRIIGQAAFQANVVGAKSIATAIAGGSVAIFNYAYLIMILPHGVFALSLATTTFPTMAAQFSDGDLEGLRNTLSRAIRVLLFLVLPSAVGMFALRREIVATLFQFGKFGQEATDAVASTLTYFALGLVAYAVVEVLTRAFYALHDTRTPVTVSVSIVVLNLTLSALLVFGLGWNQDGLAFSLAITTSLEMVLLWLFLGRKLPGWRLTADGMLLSIAKSSFAALVMGAVLIGLHSIVPTPTGGKLVAILFAVIAIGVGGAVYAIAALLLRSEELGEAVRLVRRRKA